MKTILQIILLIISISGMIYAQLPNGAKTLLHTQTATNFEQGQLQIYSNMNFFTKAGDFIGSAKPQDFSSRNYWLVAGNMIFSYGIIDHLDASLGIRLYQDTHYSNEFNLPDDIFLTVKGGSFPFGEKHFHAAFLGSCRIPSGKMHNYPFAEYTSGAFEYGFLSAFSFYSDPYLKDRAFNLHFNMGFWNYNESGRTVYKYEQDYGTHKKGDKLKAKNNAVDYRMALAAVYPTQMFDYRLEMSGILYLNKPGNFVYSAEEWAFLSPSIRYKMTDWLSIDLGADFRVSPVERQATSDLIPDISKNLDLPKNYPSWKVQLGANISLNLVESGLVTQKGYEHKREEERIKFFEDLINEQNKAVSSQKEIENLKKLRKKAEAEIDQLKEELEQ